VYHLRLKKGKLELAERSESTNLKSYEFACIQSVVFNAYEFIKLVFEVCYTHRHRVTSAAQ